MHPNLVRLLLFSAESEKKVIESSPADSFHWPPDSPAQARADALKACTERINELKAMLAENK